MSASPRLSILSATIAVALLTSACSADAGRAAASPAPARPASASPVPASNVLAPASTLPPPLASTEAGASALGRFPSPTPPHSPAPSTPGANEPTDPPVLGVELGTAAVTVGPGEAGLAGVTCTVLGDGSLRVLGGNPIDGEWIALEFRSDGTAASLSGALRGVTWSVTHDPQGSLKADGSGTFLGTDKKSGTQVGGTFACP